LAGEIVSIQEKSSGRKTPKERRGEFFRSSRNKPIPSCVEQEGGVSRLAPPAFEGMNIMTIRTRFALAVSAATVSLSLALAPSAFADDMKKDTMSKDSMAKDSMKKDTMSKDSMAKDSMKKDDAMSKDGMKKDDGMMKKN
jgi:pentapeptide MXKDX repeat protein